MQFDTGDGTISEPEEIYFPGEDAPSADPVQAASSAAPPPSQDTGDGGAQGVLPDLDPRHTLDFEGLMYLGYLSDEFVWAGHKFVIRTLTVGELLEVGLVQKRYRESLGDNRAYTAAIVAACIVNVDGKPLPQPISRDVADTRLAAQFRYVADNWYPWVIDQIYMRYLGLESRVSEILDAMGEASG